MQHQFKPSLTAEIAYVGNVGRHLFINPNVNQATLDPNCAADGTCNNWDLRRLFFQKFGLTQGIYQTCNCDNSSYHALQFKVQKRAASGLDLLLAYTYGKAMANSETGSAFSNNLNWWQDHGPANYDRTHTLTIGHTWAVARMARAAILVHRLNRGLDLVLGGWDFSGISHFGVRPALHSGYMSDAPICLR